MTKLSTIKLMTALASIAVALPAFAKDHNYTGLTTDYEKWQNSTNFRDAGKSLNTECELDEPNYDSKSSKNSQKNNYTPYYYNPDDTNNNPDDNDNDQIFLGGKKQKDLFKTNVLFRSNRYFSGHSCSDVGNPDVIINLAYDGNPKDQTYCVGKKGNKVTAVGFASAGAPINSIEAFPFQAEEQQKNICSAFNAGINAIASGKSVLVHCSKGKDRTGAYVGLLSYALAQASGMDSSDITLVEDRITCDYLRSGTGIYSNRRAPARYLDNYLEDFSIKYGSAYKFLVNECGINPDTMQKAAKNFINK